MIGMTLNELVGGVPADMTDEEIADLTQALQPAKAPAATEAVPLAPDDAPPEEQE